MFKYLYDIIILISVLFMASYLYLVWRSVYSDDPPSNGRTPIVFTESINDGLISVNFDTSSLKLGRLFGSGCL